MVGPPEHRYSILCVDDEVSVLEVLKKMLERRYTVTTAASAREALPILRTRKIDVLITDQKMPEMTGIELVAAARAEGIDVTTILLTGYTDPEDLIAAINQGQVYRYVTKPWDFGDLFMTVKNALEFTQLRREKDRLLRQLHKRVEALSVLYNVSREQTGQHPVTYDVIVDRVLNAVARVLPYDCAAALVAVDDGASAILRLRCHGLVADKGLLWVKDSAIASYRQQSGVQLTEDRLVTHVMGTASQEPGLPATFPSVLSVPLIAQNRLMGTVSLFSYQEGLYTSEDGDLLDVLANQTTDAILGLRAAEEESRRRIERMVESMADGVLLTDEKNQIVVLNPAARRMLRLSDNHQEWTARHLQDTLGFYPFELMRGWEYGGSQVLREELKIYDRTLQSTVTPVVDSRNTFRGVCVVLRDITEQKQLEERKEEFVSIVSHELRTPLTSISGALDLVLNFLAGEINEKQQRYLAMAKESTDKLNAIVDDLLDLSKFAKGRMKMSFELIYLDELVQKAVEKYGPALAEKRIRLTVNPADQPIRALADPNRLNQVLNNLLTNAVKFTPEEGEIRLDLASTAEVPGYAALTLWNSGDPIAEQDLERIFDKFEQARSERTRTVRGTGLGLAICRSIIDAHGGRIWAEPTLQGARFVAVIPVEPAPEFLHPLDDEPAAELRRAGHGRGKILVVDDSPSTAYTLKGMLLTRGYQVAVARAADQAVLVARRLRPDVIVADVRLAGKVDGVELAEIFRHDPDTRNTAVLIISAADERQRALRHGANAFLQKPIRADKLFAAVEGLVRGRSGQKQGRVLVVDDDHKIAVICSEVLSNMGFQVTLAGTVQEARRLLREQRPDVLLLDVLLPDGDGFTFLEELKAERASAHLSVIFISARAETASKVRALKLGGDDYLVKPFDALELGARVESVLRRREQEGGSSPTTQLPGSAAIERETLRRLREQRPFAFCYLDLDNLKAYNDYYGYAKADAVVRQTGDLLRQVMAQDGQADDFLGHVAGDDFVFMTSPQTVDRICRRCIEEFDRIIPLYYDWKDRERGYIEGEDRLGERRKFPIMSVSIVAVMCDGVSGDHAELARQAADLKKRAKLVQGSVYLRSDRDLPSHGALRTPAAS
jgi:DNA-binding response OmpR family regulator/signal transduction histidine kinase